MSRREHCIESKLVFAFVCVCAHGISHLSVHALHLPPQETKRKRLEVVKEKEQRDKEREQYRVKLWAYIAKKEVPKMAKMFAQARHTILTNNKKVCSNPLL